MIGKTLGHYRIIEKIGAGGMGVVYRARDERLDRDIALKVLPTGALADDAARRRFRKEALVLAKLAHPNIAMIFDFDTQDGVDFLAMEYVAGQSLAQKLDAGVIPEKEAIALGVQVAAALEEAHEQGVVHRDLNPRNILLTPKGQAKVLDFGLARLLQPPGTAEATQSFAETESIAGTLPYMAPEQLRGEALDGRTDIYALGCVFYQMAAGRRPFTGDTAPQLTDEILHQSAVSPRAVNARVSPQFEAIIAKCLEKNPENRYQSAKELSVDLRRVGMAGAVAAAATKPEQTRTHWHKLAIGGGAMAAAALLIVLVVALVILLNVGGVRDRMLGKTGAQHIRSLAVLPLENLSRDPEQEYFADGMTDQLITDLAKIQALKVISRTSVMQYKGVRKPLPQIAQELGVDAVVEGSVQRSGDRVRIIAQLIDARADQHLWARSYERDLRDVLALQDEVAQAIANELKIEIASNGKPRPMSSRPLDPDAYESYLKGRYYSSKRAEKELKKSIEYFQQAIERDANYAPAYAGMADAYALLGYRGNLPSNEALSKGKAAARKALELDDSLAEAHAALAFIAETLEWDWPTAEREYKRALELNPGYAESHNWYAGYLMYFGRFEDGITEAKRARELDPLSLPINNALGGRLLLAGRDNEAIAQIQKTLEMDPNFAPAHTQLGWAYLKEGMNQDAISEFQKGVTLSGSDPEESVDLGYAYAVTGKQAEAKKILAKLKKKRERAFVSPAALAIVSGALGEKDEAFAWLEKAYEVRDPTLTYLKVGPKFTPLRSDPRFQDLLRRMGLPL
jgi:TolB-like protein/Flp pilus assembly protein TadD/predicted Ser/Thr protein kinase